MAHITTTRNKNKTRPQAHWVLLVAMLVFGGFTLADALAQNSAMVRSGAGSSSLTVQQLGQQATSLRARNVTQSSNITTNQAEMDDIEDDTAVQQTRIDDLDTELTAAQPTGSDLDDRAEDALTDAQTIQPHAKANMPTGTSPANKKCPPDQKLYWTGGAWSCIPETDPTLGIHGRNTKIPPSCALDEKTIWDVPTNTWSCAPELDVTGAAGPDGPDGAPGADGIDGGGIWQFGTGGKIYYNAGLVGVGGGVQSGMALYVTGNATIDGNLDVGGNVRPPVGRPPKAVCATTVAMAMLKSA